MHSLVKSVESNGWRVGPNGGISPINPNAVMPTGQGEAADIYAMSTRVRDFDESTARSLTALAKDAEDTLEKHNALDSFNAHRLTALDGALDGVDWTLGWDYDDLLPKVWDLKWPAKGVYLDLLRGDVLYALEDVGRIPAWLQKYLIDGTMPSPTEMLAFHAFNALQNDDGMRRKLWEMLNGQQGSGAWPPELRDLVTFFRDGSPLLPTEFRDVKDDAHGSI